MKARLATARAFPWLAVTTLFVVSLPFIYFTLDDAGITLRYSYNLAHHGVLSFNVDDRVYGTTSILWALLCVPLMLPEDPMVGLWLSKVASFVCLAAACWIFARLLTSPTAKPLPQRTDASVPLSTWVSRAVFLIAVVGSVPFAAFAWSGMEFGLGLLLLAVFVHSWLRRQEWALSWMSVTAVALAFTRPDYCLLTAPPLLWTMIERLRHSPRALLQVLPAVGLGAAALWVLWAYYGDPVPLPFYAKVLAPARDPGVIAGLRRIGSWWMLQAGWVVVPALGYWVASRSTRQAVAQRLNVTQAQSWMLFVSATLLFLFYVSRGGNIVMDTAGRYYAPFLTLFALLAAPTVERLCAARQIWALRARWLVPAGALLALVALGGALLWDANLRTRGSSRSLHAYATGMTRAYIPMGQFIAEHYPHETRLMLHDAGLVPLFSRARVLDVWSLNNREIIDCKGTCREDVARRFRPDLVLQDHELLPPSAKLTVVHETGPNPPKNRKLTLREVHWADR